jgi:hypothetical protein
MQCFEFGNHQRNKSFAISGLNRCRYLLSDAGRSRLLNLTHNRGNHLVERVAIAQAKRVRRHEVLLHRHVLLARARLRPRKNIQQQFNAVQFVHAKNAVHIVLRGHIHERQRTQVVRDERNVRREARHPLVHVLKRL